MNLALKYRPKTFAEVVEQTITTAILQKVIAEKKFKNCILLTGASGCGKTTCARIFAKAINEGIGEPIEIDAASNNSVDNVRAIVEDAESRSLIGEYKVYIIDECHMITTAGWNAFLKTIEEPPKYTIFIFCTTDPQKIPATILNRVQRYNLAKISKEGIKARLEYICQQEGFTNYEQTCDFISKMSQGGMRDAISYLDQVADYSTDLNLEVAEKIIGGLSYRVLFGLTFALLNKDEGTIISTIENLYNNGQDLRMLLNNYIDFVLDLIKYKLFNTIAATSIPEYLAAADNNVVGAAADFSGALDYYNKLVDTLLDIKLAIKNDTNCKSTIEIMLIRAARELA